MNDAVVSISKATVVIIDGLLKIKL